MQNVTISFSISYKKKLAEELYHKLRNLVGQQPNSAAPAATSDGPTAQIEKLSKLKDQGILSEEE